VRRQTALLLAAMISAISLCLAMPALARPRPGIDLGIHITAPPSLAVVPGLPVYYAPTLPYNYFFDSTTYYVFLRNHWYAAPTYNGPWVKIAVAQVPPPILAVPVEYYRAPPAHWTRPGPPPWAEGGRGYGHWHEREERHR
jgi:YXWGXW repeat-containing protein